MTIEIEAGASHCQCSMDSLMQQLFHTCFTDGPESGRLTVGQTETCRNPCSRALGGCLL
jgi:hypothetical protein